MSLTVKIKTLDEARESRAELVVEHDGAGERTLTIVELNAEVQIVKDLGEDKTAAAYTVDDIVEAQATEGEYIAGQYRATIEAMKVQHRAELAEMTEKMNDLQAKLDYERNRADVNYKNWDEETKRADLAQFKVKAYDEDRHSEQNRANEAKALVKTRNEQLKTAWMNLDKERDRADQNKEWAERTEARLKESVDNWNRMSDLIHSITDEVTGCLESWVTPPVEEIRRLIAEAQKNA